MSCVVNMMRRGERHSEIAEDSAWLQAFYYVPIFGDLFTALTLNSLNLQAESVGRLNPLRESAVHLIQAEYCGIGVTRHIISLVAVVAARHFGIMGNGLSVFLASGSFIFIWLYAYGVRLHDHMAHTSEQMHRLRNG